MRPPRREKRNGKCWEENKETTTKEGEKKKKRYPRVTWVYRDLQSMKKNAYERDLQRKWRQRKTTNKPVLGERLSMSQKGEKTERREKGKNAPTSRW